MVRTSGGCGFIKGQSASMLPWPKATKVDNTSRPLKRLIGSLMLLLFVIFCFFLLVRSFAILDHFGGPEKINQNDLQKNPGSRDAGAFFPYGSQLGYRSDP